MQAAIPIFRNPLIHRPNVSIQRKGPELFQHSRYRKIPVSYTHLDVYKRQADNGSLNAFSNQGFITNYYKSAVESTGFTLTSSTEQKASDLFLENASFLKMDNITLGYTFKNLFTSKLDVYKRQQ